MNGVRIHRAGSALALVLLLAGAAGLPACTKKAAPVAPVIQAPLRDSPQNTLLLLQRALENLDFATVRTLFTDDFVFVFAETDSAGNAFRDTPWGRMDELISHRNMLVGGSSTEPPADRITLEFTNTLTAFGSTFPGHDPRWHKTIRAEVYLRIDRGESTLEIRGPGLFGFVRGDSAAIPQELLDEGFRPDSAQWWIERWEDETVSSAGSAMSARAPRAAPQPSTHTSWGSIKSLYR